MPEGTPPPSAPIPASPAYAQINFVGDQVSTTTSPGVSNEMLLVGICHLMAQMVVRVDASNGGVLPSKHILAGLLQKIEEVTPKIIPNVNVRPG